MNKQNTVFFHIFNVRFRTMLRKGIFLFAFVAKSGGERTIYQQTFSLLAVDCWTKLRYADTRTCVVSLTNTWFRTDVSQTLVQKYGTVCCLHSDSLAQVLLCLNILNPTCSMRFETEALRRSSFYGRHINSFYVCTGWPKKRAHFFVSLNFVFNFFTFKIRKTCNSTVAKDPTTPQVCRYTTLWNISVLKATIENKTTSVSTHFKSASSSSKADTLNILCKTVLCDSYFG